MGEIEPPHIVVDGDSDPILLRNVVGEEVVALAPSKAWKSRDGGDALEDVARDSALLMPRSRQSDGCGSTPFFALPQRASAFA